MHKTLKEVQLSGILVKAGTLDVMYKIFKKSSFDVLFSMSFCLQAERWMGFPESLFYRFCWQLYRSTSFQALLVLFLRKTQNKTKLVHLLQTLQRKIKETLPTEKFVFNHFIFISSGCPGALGTHRKQKPGTFALIQNLSLATNIKHGGLTDLGC